MLPSQLLTSLQNLYNTTQPASATKPPSAAGGNNNKPQIDFTTGQKLDATVLSREGQGIYRVAVAGQTMQMRLPESVLPNSRIQLTVVNTQPKVTFSLLSTQTPISNPAQIGSTAKLLAELSNQPLEQLSSKTLAQQPIWPTDKTPDSKEMANALRTTLMNSGLFYESHQAQWVKGERSISELLLEPQNRLTSPHKTENTSSTLPQQQQLTINKELLPLVQQQLHTLESNQLIWHGQVWHDQNMRWEVHKENKNPYTPQEEAPWSTEMSLDLPFLGDIEAKLNLTTEGLSLQLRAKNEETLNKFTQAMPQLYQALETAGIRVIRSTISHHE